ncbi:hypothetical protein PtB15_10B662 [Puccinia triticina]|nr:hypothetical protein PtB15_10B662 [Puccinia triticina]
MAARLRSDSRLQPLLKQEQPSHNLGARFKGIGLLWQGIVPTPKVTILDRDHVVYILGFNMLRSASSNHHLTPSTVSRLPGGNSAEGCPLTLPHFEAPMNAQAAPNISKLCQIWKK